MCFGGKCDLIYIYITSSTNYIWEINNEPAFTLTQDKCTPVAGSPPPYSNSATPGAESSLTTPFKDPLMTLLGIPKHLSNCTD